MTKFSGDKTDVTALVRYAQDLECQVERLTERCAMYKGQVEAGSHEIERLRALLTSAAEHRIDAESVMVLDQNWRAENEQLRSALKAVQDWMDGADIIAGHPGPRVLLTGYPKDDVDAALLAYQQSTKQKE